MDSNVIAMIKALGGGSGGVSSWDDLPAPMPGKYLPNGVPYVEEDMMEVLPECQPTYDEDDGAFFNIPLQGVLSVGGSYTVNWNGAEYECITQDMSAMMPGAVLLGDGTNFGAIGNGEPFTIVCMEQNGAYGAMAMPLDGTSELTLSIKGVINIYHKLDKALLPTEALNNVLVVCNKPEKDENGNDVATHSFMEIVMAQASGKAVFLNRSGDQYTYAGSNFDAQQVYFVCPQYNGVNTIYHHIFSIDANGVLQEIYD